MPETIAPFTGFGLGLRKEHHRDFLEAQQPVDFVEIISENFMACGGRPLRTLDAVRERHPVAMHGVSMSLGSAPRSRCRLSGRTEAAGGSGQTAVAFRPFVLDPSGRPRHPRPAAFALHRRSARGLRGQCGARAGRARAPAAGREPVELCHLPRKHDVRVGIPHRTGARNRLLSVARRQQRLCQQRQPSLRSGRLPRRNPGRPGSPDAPCRPQAPVLRAC